MRLRRMIVIDYSSLVVRSTVNMLAAVRVSWVVRGSQGIVTLLKRLGFSIYMLTPAELSNTHSCQLQLSVPLILGSCKVTVQHACSHRNTDPPHASARSYAKNLGSICSCTHRPTAGHPPTLPLIRAGCAARHPRGLQRVVPTSSTGSRLRLVACWSR
jgi:hypothetical protein